MSDFKLNESGVIKYIGDNCKRYTVECDGEIYKGLSGREVEEISYQARFDPKKVKWGEE